MFIFMEKNNFTTHLILEILLRYCKLVIMGTLDMLGYGYNKMVISVWKESYLHAKNQIYCSPYSSNIAEALQICYFGDFENVWPRPPKNSSVNLWKTFMFIYMHQINWISRFFLEILHFKKYSNQSTINQSTYIFPD